MTDAALTPREVTLAAIAGVQRGVRHLHRQTHTTYGARERDPAGWTYNIQGAIGEWFVAKALGVYWHGGVECENGAADLPGDIEVRTTAMDHYALLVHPTDADERPFVLVVGIWPRMRIAGWMMGADAKQARWWNEGLPVPAYVVPQSELHDIAELRTAP